MEGKIQVSPDDVKRTYDSQKDRFKIPKRVKAREILIKVGPEDTSDKIDEKRKRRRTSWRRPRRQRRCVAGKQFSESETASKEAIGVGSGRGRDD
jgi:parvulin-like peptidyl-prolyl isomerase